MAPSATLLKLPVLFPASLRPPGLAPPLLLSSFRLRAQGRVAGECRTGVREFMKVKTAALRSGEAGGEEGVGIFQGGGDGDGDSSPPVGHGFEATLNRLSKWIVAAVFCGVVLLKHDAESLWVVLGSFLNSNLSHVLKQILNQERPVSTLRSDPGMPSSHAQCIFFIASFVIQSSIEWLGIDVISVMISILALAIGTYLTWLRVLQQLHTIEQVTVGAAVGTMFAALWFWSWKGVVFKAFDSFLWVRIVVALGAASFCLSLLAHVIQHWSQGHSYVGTSGVN